MDHLDYVDWAKKFVHDAIVSPKPFNTKVQELVDKLIEIESLYTEGDADEMK